MVSDGGGSFVVNLVSRWTGEVMSMPERATTLLAALIGLGDMTHQELVEHFMKVARENGEDATLSVRTLHRWINGDIRSSPRPAQQRVARLVWGYPISRLLGPVPPELSVSARFDMPSLVPGHPLLNGPTKPSDGLQDLSNLERQVAMSARRASRFSAAAEVDNIGPEALNQLRQDVGRLANDYLHLSLTAILGDLLTKQDRVFTLLEGRQRPGVTKDLYFLAGVVSGLMAKASQDLGKFHDAMTHARTAYICADGADVPGLRAWARGLQSLISFWAGRPQEAAQYARRGSELAATVSESVAVWLPALEARALASMSLAGEATGALRMAEDRRQQHVGGDLDEMGGLLAFVPAKQQYYAAGTYVSLEGKAREGAEAGRTALRLFEQGPSDLRSFSDEAGARAELGLALVHDRQIDGAGEAIAAVLELEPQRRIGGIISSVQRIHLALGSSYFNGSAEAAGLRYDIEEFTRTPAAALGT
jgi:hypothetical protein